MANILLVPHYPQKADGYCLAACAQMALAHLGVFRSQDDLAREMGLRPPFGAPAFNIIRLQSADLAVTYASGTLQDLAQQLAQAVPVIAFVQAGELAHWHGHRSQHAVVIVGLDADTLYLLDPAAEAEPIPVSIGEWLLAWEEMDCLCATLTRQI